MIGTLKNIAGPAFIANAATNIYTPAAATIATILRHIHFVNVTTSAQTFSLYIGATGASVAGTEIFKDFTIPAKGTYDLYLTPGRLMLSTDFLVGIAASASSVTINVMGEFYVV